MKFPLSLDLRKATLEANPGPGVEVIDANYNRVMTIYPDSVGRYERAGEIVDALNETLGSRQ